ncbi:MAG: pseudouridine synthase, partial [Eubacteriales bacterium]|nr:pseudouridine synthase [Eubacteriales bacterium]
MALIRLDKLIAQSGEHTRSEAVKLIRSGAVTADGRPVCDPSAKLNADQCEILLNGQPVNDVPFRYVMLHKPAGLLTATRDRNAPTVMDLLPEALKRRKVMPVGRLDKDTTGLLLLTNDGTLAHRLLAPGRHVWKEYLATVDGPLTTEDADAFAAGMELSDFTAKPAQLRVLENGPEQSRAIVLLAEGKFHQVKRMFGARGREVLALHRQGFGPIRLDIPVGEWRELNREEKAAL